MPLITVRTAVHLASIAAARRVPASVVPLAAHEPRMAIARRGADRMIAEARRETVRRAESTHRARSVWNYRWASNFYRSKNASPHWFGRFTTPSARIL